MRSADVKLTCGADSSLMTPALNDAGICLVGVCRRISVFGGR